MTDEQCIAIMAAVLVAADVVAAEVRDVYRAVEKTDGFEWRHRDEADVIAFARQLFTSVTRAAAEGEPGR